MVLSAVAVLVENACTASRRAPSPPAARARQSPPPYMIGGLWAEDLSHLSHGETGVTEADIGRLLLMLNGTFLFGYSVKMRSGACTQRTAQRAVPADASTCAPVLEAVALTNGTYGPTRQCHLRDPVLTELPVKWPDLSWLLRGFSTCCLRFKNGVATTPAKLASGWLARLYREGVEPSGSLQKVSDHPSSFSGFILAQGKFHRGPSLLRAYSITSSARTSSVGGTVIQSWSRYSSTKNLKHWRAVRSVRGTDR